MITAELSQFLEHKEKESILRGISANEKIVSSGVCQLLTVENEKWKSSQAAVVLFLKNSSEKYYKITVIEPSNDEEWEPTQLFEHAFSNKEFETIQMHANLLIFEANSGDIGLNFYDSKECLKFHDAVCKRKTKSTASQPDNVPALDGKKAKKKKSSKGLFRGLFGISSHSSHSKDSKEKKMEIGSPTDFRHVESVKMNNDQEELYQQVMSKLKTSSKEEEEMVKKIVLTNEDHLRKSIMVKKEPQTPKSVKEKKEKKSFFNRHSKGKIEIEPEPTPIVIPHDPLNPDWSSDAPTAPTASSTYSTPTVTTKTSFFKHSHTFAPDPLKNPDWEAPRKDTYGRANEREPQNVYRFQEETVEVEVFEQAPELPSRSTSRHVGEALSAPRPPNHRGSYRWATQPESMSPSKPSYSITTSSSVSSTAKIGGSSRETERFAELRLTTPNPVRTAPPPPASAPSVKTSAPVEQPETKAMVAPPSPPPLPTIAKSPPPPPLPTISTSAPPPPPPPPTSSGADNSEESAPKIRLVAVPEVSADRRSLLDQIQSADRSKILRKVSDTDARQSVTTPTSGTMIDQIQNFLDARRAGINPSDSEESDDEDEEWSD